MLRRPTHNKARLTPRRPQRPLPTSPPHTRPASGPPRRAPKPSASIRAWVGDPTPVLIVVGGSGTAEAATRWISSCADTIGRSVCTATVSGICSTTSSPPDDVLVITGFDRSRSLAHAGALRRLVENRTYAGLATAVVVPHDVLPQWRGSLDASVGPAGITTVASALQEPS